MKTTVYFFSGTGNTLMLARLLAEKLGNTEIINIVDCHGSITSPQADRVGILYPVYACRLPKMMRDFVKNDLRINADTYVFSLTNYASFGGPASLHQLKSILEAKGGKLHAGFGLSMPPNDFMLGGAESQEKQTKHFDTAAEGIRTIAEIIEEAPENYSYHKGNIPLFMGRLSFKFFFWYCAQEFKKFYTSDNCTSCGLCAKICPLKNIKLVDGRPRWETTDCEQCLACLQWCPALAIQRKGVAEKRTRYHNPTVNAQDLMSK